MKPATPEQIFDILQRVKNGERTLFVARSTGFTTSSINYWKLDYLDKSLEEIIKIRTENTTKATKTPKKPRKTNMWVGFKYQRLTAVAPDIGSKWFFQCECGNKKSIRARDVRNGCTGSCGCFAKETRKRLKNLWWCERKRT